MHEIGVEEAQTNLSAILDQVRNNGCTIVVQRDGKSLAALIPIEDLTLIQNRKSEYLSNNDRILRQSEALLRQTMRTANMGAWVWDDVKDESIYCSEELASLFGQSVEEYLATRSKGPGVTARIHPDDREYYRKTIEDSVAASRRYFVEFREMVADGTYRHFREIGEPIREKPGLRIRSTGIVQDITELKEAERVLRLNEVALIRAQRQGRIGSWRWDVPGRKLISCSEEYARIHDVKIEEAPDLLAKQIEQVIHPDDREWVETEFNRFDDEGIDYEIEYRIIRPNGEVRHVLVIGEAVRDASGTLIERTGTVQDITERKQADEALRQAHDELEKRVESRTTELREANEALEREIAGRKKTEIALNKNVALMQALIEHSPVAISIKELDGRYSFVSPAYTRYLDMSAEEAIGKRAKSILSSDASAALEAADQIVIKSGEALKHDQSFSIKFGSSTLLVTKFPILDFDGKVISIGTVGVDVTEQRRFEQKLAESEDRFRRAVVDAPIPIIMHAEDGEVLMVSKKWTELSGYSHAEIPTTSDWTEKAYGVDKQHRDRQRGIIGELYEMETADEHEAYITTASGERRLWEVHDAPLGRLADGRRFVISMIVDITERTQVEDALKESRDQLRLITDNLPVHIAYLDRNLRYRFVNRRISQSYARPVEQILGERIDQMFDPATLAKLLPHIRKALGGDAEEFEERLTYPDGTDRDVELIYVPHFGEDGSILGIFSLTLDITEQKRAEEQLRQAQKMEAVGQLTGGVAHDFNNMLAVIMGNAELLAGKSSPADKRLQMILNAAQYGAELTQRLLAFSRKQPL